MICVYEYTDYRRYLKDYYQDQKRQNRAFSYRYFAQKAQTGAYALYKQVLDGKRGLSRGLILKFAKAMKLKKREAEYFENMVLFNEAKTVEERKLFFERMMAVHESKAYLLDAGQYELYSKWYCVALCGLLSFAKIKDDYAALGKALNPPIRPDQAQKAVKTLENLGLVRRNKGGYIERIDAHVTTGPEVRSLSVANFQKATSDLAKEALDRHSAKRRDMSTLTLSISEETFALMKEEIIAFRKKLLSMEEKCKKPDRVYQLNHHFFPLTRIAEAS